MTQAISPNGASATTSLYLTRIRLNPASRRVRIELADSQALHRRVMSLFPDVEDSAARAALNVLYRVDPPAPGQTARVLLVQSAVAPRVEALPADMLFSDDTWGVASDAAATRDVAAAYASLQAGQRLAFRLRANVTKRLWLNNPNRLAAEAPNDPLFNKYRARSQERGGKGSGPRVGLFKEEEQLAWLARQGETHGFTIENVRIERGAEQLRREDGASHDDDVRAVQAQKQTAVGWKGGEGAGRRHQRPDLVHNAVTFEGILTITDPNAFQEALRVGIGPAKAYGFGLLSIRPLR